MRTEDGRIIQECLNGESESFGMLVDKYKEGIYAFVYNKLRNFQDAQDVTQEVFLKAYKDLHSLKRLESFAFWLYRIAYSRCIEFLRSKSKRVDTDSIEDQDTKIIDAHSMDYYRENQISESVRDALDSLPEAYREALMLHYFGGMNSSEIANALGTSPTAIRMRLSRAREQMKEEILAVIGTAFEGQKLRVGFTFRVVEAIKQIKVQPISPKTLPWGISLGAGLIFTVLMFGQHIKINLPDISMGLPLPSEMKVLKIGEIPVDAVKVSTITSIGNKGNGKGVAPDLKGQENAFFMASQGEGGKWEQKANMPTARMWGSCAEVDAKIYVMGGFRFGIVSSANEMYDPKLDEWTIKEAMPIAEVGLSTTAINGKIYALGGFQSSINQEYDPKSDSWQNKASMPSPKQYHSAVVYNNKIYIFGGWSDMMTPSLSCFMYDPISDTWSQLKTIPQEFYMWGSSAVVFNDTVYFMGGMNVGNSAIKNVISYNFETQTWDNLAKSIVPRAYGFAGIINDKVFFIGGCENFDPNKGTSSVEEYDIKTNTISNKLEMPNRRVFITGCTLGNQIYIFGGSTDWFVGAPAPNDYLQFNELYTPDIESKSVDPSGKLPKTWGTIKAK